MGCGPGPKCCFLLVPVILVPLVIVLFVLACVGSSPTVRLHDGVTPTHTIAHRSEFGPI